MKTKYIFNFVVVLALIFTTGFFTLIHTSIKEGSVEYNISCTATVGDYPNFNLKCDNPAAPTVLHYSKFGTKAVFKRESVPVECGVQETIFNTKIICKNDL